MKKEKSNLLQNEALNIGVVNERSLFELRKRAEKVADLIELMNEAFPKYPRENIITACMACIQDAYYTG